MLVKEIEHSGIKGMKWYEHKFGRWQKHAQYAGGQDDPDAKKYSDREAARKEKILSNPRKLRKYYKEFSDEEINRAIKNFETEYKLKKIAADDIRLGADVVNSISTIGSNMFKGYNGAAAIYNALPMTKGDLPILNTKPKKGNK